MADPSVFIVTCYSSEVTLLPDLQHNVTWLLGFLAPREASHWLAALLSLMGRQSF